MPEREGDYLIEDTGNGLTPEDPREQPEQNPELLLAEMEGDDDG